MKYGGVLSVSEHHKVHRYVSVVKYGDVLPVRERHEVRYRSFHIRVQGFFLSLTKKARIKSTLIRSIKEVKHTNEPMDMKNLIGPVLVRQTITYGLPNALTHGLSIGTSTCWRWALSSWVLDRLQCRGTVLLLLLCGS